MEQMQGIFGLTFGQIMAGVFALFAAAVTIGAMFIWPEREDWEEEDGGNQEENTMDY